VSKFSKITARAGTFTDPARLWQECRTAVCLGRLDNDGDPIGVAFGYTGSTYISKIYRNDSGTSQTQARR